MTFKGYIRRVYVLHIETKIHTEPLIQYVFSSIKYPFTCPFFGSADCLLCRGLKKECDYGYPIHNKRVGVILYFENING